MLDSLLKPFIRFFVAFLLCLLSIRLFEFFTLSDREGYLYSLSFRGIVNDISFSARLFLIVFIFQLIVNAIFKKHFTFLFLYIPASFLIIEWILLEYFKESGILLDEVLYAYTQGELKVIIGGSSSINITFLVGIFFLLLIYFGIGKAIKLRNDKYLKPLRFGGVFIAICCFLPSTTFTKNEDFNQFANNKTAYFIGRTIHYLNNSEELFYENVALITTDDFKNIDSNFLGGKAINEEYPYFHELSKDSELSELLHKTSDEKPPNIVFLICESLATQFVGDSAYQSGRMMPFLDSLINQSLYWPNFMSVCDRTYHVLPASLASVPIMKGGRIFHQVDFPAHFSLINLLEESYYSRFYCGTYLGFTDMDRFLNYYNTSYLVKDWEEEFASGKYGKKMTWGYHEKAVFKKSWIDYEKQDLANKKRLDIFLTNSTHPPFDLENKDFYIEKVKKLLLKNQKKYNEDYSRIFTKLNELVTYNHLDTELEAYFKEAKLHPDYENTIFIIYGDHGQQGLMVDALSNYKIPLIIYSPLLKKPDKFLGVSTHLDLAPTLMSYLKANYLPDLPEKTTFVGKGLSFSKEYENNRSFLMGTNIRSSEFLFHDGYFLTHSQLYKVTDNLGVQEVDDPAQITKLLEQKEQAISLSNYTIFQDKFGPIDYLEKYIKIADKLSDYQLMKIVKEKKVNVKKNDLPIEFVNIGEDAEIDANIKKLGISFSVDYKSKIDSSLQTIPRFTFSLHYKDEVLYWGNIPYLNQNEYLPNKWNHIEAKTILDLAKELRNKKIKGKITLRYYVLNNELIDFEMKNSTVQLYK